MGFFSKEIDFDKIFVGFMSAIITVFAVVVLQECEKGYVEENTPTVRDLGEVSVYTVDGHEIVVGEYYAAKYNGLGIYHTVSCPACTPADRQAVGKQHKDEVVMVMTLQGHQYVATKYKESWCATQHSKNCPYCTNSKQD